LRGHVFVTRVALVQRILPASGARSSVSHLPSRDPTTDRSRRSLGTHFPPNAERINGANAVVHSISERRVTGAPVRPPPIFVARSSAFRQALERVRRLAKTDMPVIIEGETGTGKSYFAELLHAESSRANGPFQLVDLAELDEGLVASELFGHAKGAFTGASARRPGLLASANGGTVFLDEMGKASHQVQAKLLRVIERHEVRSLGEDRVQALDIRFVAASADSLCELVQRGKVLSDLYFRLQGHRIYVPPLRERRPDIPELVEHFARSGAVKCRYPDGPPRFDAKVVRALVAAPWPGNLRQLDRAVTTLMIEADGAPRVTCKHLRDDLEYLAELSPLDNDQERAEIEIALAQTNDHRGNAAQLLSMSRAKFYRRLKKLSPGGIEHDRLESAELGSSEA
jgi:DNA-binding NtrC family response regulator